MNLVCLVHNYQCKLELKFLVFEHPFLNLACLVHNYQLFSTFSLDFSHNYSLMFFHHQYIDYHDNLYHSFKKFFVCLTAFKLLDLLRAKKLKYFYSLLIYIQIIISRRSYKFHKYTVIY